MSSTTGVWIVLWAFSLIVFLTVPIITNDRRRELWIKRLRECRWRVQITDDDSNEEEGGDEEDNNNNNNSADSNNYRYVLSRAQEDEIREAFLRTKLTKYSKALSASDIAITNKSPTTSKSPTTVVQDETTADLENNSNSARKSTNGSNENQDLVESDEGTEAHVQEKGKRVSLDDQGDDDSSSEDDDEEVGEYSRNEFVSDQSTHVQIPNLERLLGCPSAGTSKREVPNGCAICLSGFEAGETVCWSANAQCKHVFHHECILDWFVASGRKQMRRRRRGDVPTPPSIADDDCVALVTDFPMQCPCCRQDFVCKDDDDEESSSDSDKERREGEQQQQRNVSSTTDAAATSDNTPALTALVVPPRPTNAAAAAAASAAMVERMASLRSMASQRSIQV